MDGGRYEGGVGGKDARCLLIHLKFHLLFLKPLVVGSKYAVYIEVIKLRSGKGRI